MNNVQATTMGVLSAAMFFVLSNSKPLAKLSAERPHPNIWCIYVFASLLGQFLVHVVFLAWCYSSAKAAMPEVCTPPSLADSLAVLLVHQNKYERLLICVLMLCCHVVRMCACCRR